MHDKLNDFLRRYSADTIYDIQFLEDHSDGILTVMVVYQDWSEKNA